MFCDICWHVDGVARRETALHVARDCPYSRLVVDPLLRELASRFDGGSRLSGLSSQDLIAELELLLLAGSNLSSS